MDLAQYGAPLTRPEQQNMVISVVTCRPQAIRLLFDATPNTAALRLLSLQEPTPQPVHGYWGILPPLPDQVVIDTVGISPITLTMVLTDLHTQQRRADVLPIFLLDPMESARCILVALSPVRGLVLSAQAPLAATTASVRWSHSVRFYAQHQYWLAALPPGGPLRHDQFIPLLAALSQAASFDEASTWISISRRTAYDLMKRACTVLGVTDCTYRRTPAQWCEALLTALERSIHNDN